MPVLDLESRGDEELLEVENMTEEERKKGDIKDMSWDQGEDHLMVAFGHGKLAMINFDGFSEDKALWKFLYEIQVPNLSLNLLNSKDERTYLIFYERQKQGVNNIAWKEDRSGDFIVSSRKIGTIKVFNVAARTAKQIIKIGSLGIHYMKKLDSQRVVLSLVNGAIQIFNLAKRKIEFQTEAGHAETVFDLQLCPSNKDILASCSYDGSVRIWDVNSMKLMQIQDTLKVPAIAKEEKHIIYSVSWHPVEQKIALVGQLGYLLIYDCLKNRGYKQILF